MFLKSLNFKIAALFSGIFILASAVLFFVSYLFQYNALVMEDVRNLNARTIEFWAVYQTGGAVAIQRALNIESFLTDYDPFLLRIASSTNKTLAIYYPSSWKHYQIESLEELDPFDSEGPHMVPSGEDNSFLDMKSAPLPDGNILQIGTSSAKRQILLSRFRSIYLVVLIPIIALSFTGGIFFSIRTLRPINRLIAVTRGIIETGNMGKRLPLNGRGDELDELTDLFNKMLERIESLLERMRTSLDNVAHDLRTPMTRLRHKLEDETKDTEEKLAGAVEEAEHIRTMLNTLMDISEAEAGVMKLNRKGIDLSEIVADLTEFYGYVAEEKGVDLQFDTGGPVTVSVDVDRIRQAITNLLDNAVKYTRPGDKIEVSVDPDGENGHPVLSVSDTGVGIPEEDIPYIWDRLFRGDRSRSEPGLGLGLGLVKAIVEAHGGTVAAESAPGKGARFTITLV